MIEPLRQGADQNLHDIVQDPPRTSNEHDRTIYPTHNWNANRSTVPGPALTPNRQRVTLDTARNGANISRRGPLTTLPNFSNAAPNFLATPKHHKPGTVANRTASRAAQPMFGGRSL